VVLTGAPSSEVVLDITPEFTRTYNEALSSDENQNFGEHEDRQVRVATTQALIQLTAGPSAAESWQVLLSNELKFGTGWKDSPDVVNVVAGQSPSSIRDALVLEINAYRDANSNQVYTAVAVGDAAIRITSASPFYADFVIADTAMDIDSSRGTVQRFDRTPVDGRSEVAFELGGLAGKDEAWSVTLDGKPFTYTVKFGDSPAAIARGIAAKIGQHNAMTNPAPAATYDVTVFGSVITIRGEGPGDTFTAAFSISPRSSGAVTVMAQLVFTDQNWFTAQSVAVMAVDDDYIDGGDALVFPAAEQRANIVRGPLTVEGGVLLGAEIFFNDPLLLPLETNVKIADGLAETVGLDADTGHAFISDPDASHLNALSGLRPGFDPRMTDSLFYFTFLDGEAQGGQLTVESVSRDILSFANAGGLRVAIDYSGAQAAPDLVRFFGETAGNAAVQWGEAVLRTDGAVAVGEQWSLTLSGIADPLTVKATEGTATVAQMAIDLARQLNASGAFSAEIRIGLRGEANLLVKPAIPGTEFTMDFAADMTDATEDLSQVDYGISGFTSVLPDGSRDWLMGAFYFSGAGAVGETWTLTVDGTPRTPVTVTPIGVEALTVALADGLPGNEYLPLVSGTQVTFRSGWPQEPGAAPRVPASGDGYFYAPLNPNLFVSEDEQVDVLNVFNADSPAHETATLTGDHLTGLGMGGRTVIAGRTLEGGIVYHRIEDLNIVLGRGVNEVRVVSTHTGATTISSKGGEDVYDIESVLGHTVIDGGDGVDHFNVGTTGNRADLIADHPGRRRQRYPHRRRFR
jgi:hypothetical protein